MARGVYTLTKAITNPSTANVVVQIKPGASNAIKIHRLTITQTGSTTSTNAEVLIKRLSAAGSAGTAFADTDVGRRAGDGVCSLTYTTTGTAYSLGSAGTAASSAGSLLDRGFNIVTGFDDYPVPEDRIDVPAAGFLGIFMPVAPAGTYVFEVTFEEVG
jgi:hypothetical protein